ncbi:MAG: peptidoglycan DD-metalloendopeptidase family protein [Pseudomonadota bacterium]
MAASGPLLAGAVAGASEIDRARILLQDAETSLNRVASSQKHAQLSALGQAVKAHEAALAALRQRLRQLAAREQEIAGDLAGDRARLTEVLAALQSLSQAPRSALLAFPGGPVRAARAATLMQELTPKLEAQSAAIRDRLDQIRQLRAQQETARVEARGALARLQGLRARTAQILRSRTRRIPADEISAQAEAAARQAESLRQLTAALDRRDIASAAGASTRFEALRGSLPLPVSGRIASSFGTEGRRGFGLTLAAPAYGQVIAPVGGTIRYVGDLKGYGTVALLEPEAGWMIILAGLGAVDRNAGETVLAGERIGDLGGPLPTSEEFLLEAGDQAGEIEEETLYIELRRGDNPVDPAPWFQISG